MTKQKFMDQVWKDKYVQNTLILAALASDLTFVLSELCSSVCIVSKFPKNISHVF